VQIYPCANDISVALASKSALVINVHKLSRPKAVQSLGTLAADAEFLDKCEVFITALLGDVLKQPLALADQLQ
jgi:hypothetical protein